MRATNGRVKWMRHLEDSHLEAAALTDEVAFKPKGSSSSSFFFEERIEEILDETCWLVSRVKLVEVELADVCWWIEGAGIGESSSLTRMPSGTAEDMARSTTDFFSGNFFTARFQKLQLKNKHLSTCTQLSPTFHSRNLIGCCQTVYLTLIFEDLPLPSSNFSWLLLLFLQLHWGSLFKNQLHWNLESGA